MSKIPNRPTYNADLVGLAIRAIFEFAGPDVEPATAAALLRAWRRAAELTEQQQIAIVASFEILGT
jgi:hypothetical protein